MSRPVFSVVCVHNNEKVLNDWLLEGLKDQDSKFEVILVDNTAGKFKSAAEGLNYGGAKAAGEYLVFIHQDVRLLSSDWLRRAEAFLRALPGLGVAGIAGMIGGKAGGIFRAGTIPVKNRIFFVYQGLEKERLEFGSASGQPVEVQTLDEQLLIIPREVFLGGKFDAAACGGWHLYGVDYSLSARRRGFRTFALPLPVWHMSGGKLDADYFRTLNKVLEKHSAEKVLYTTCGLWHTSNLFNVLDLLLLAARSQLARWAGRNTYGAKPYLDTLKMLLGRSGR